MKAGEEDNDRAGGDGADPAAGDGRLPVAAARIAVLKASYRQAWLYFLLAVCMVVAWWFPVQNAVRRRLALRPAVTGPRDAMEFVALAYEGISDHPSEVSPRQFRDQIAELRRAGYSPVTLREVFALFEEGRPLPRRAILLTFDQSRKSSYFEARSVLQRAGWNAVMFLWTRPILEGEPASLRWPYIRRMLRGGAWELGAQSHDGFRRIASDPSGAPGNFLTTPRWLGAEGRYETPAEFMQRVAQDHETTRRILQRETGRAPMAFAFPYGDFGQHDERAVLTRRFHLDFVSRYYDLGFILGSACLNTRHSDPRRLSRMLVRPEWSARELLQRLERAWPRPDGFAADAAFSDPLDWLVDWGEFALRGDHALLAARPDTTGAKAWLNGSDSSRDVHVRLRFRPDRGQVGVFLRASPDGESNIYLGLEDDGRAWLRQKHTGMQPFTLATGRYAPDAYGEAELDLFLRDRLLFAAVNGRPVFDEIPRVRGESRPGMIGLSVWHPEPGAGRVALNAFGVRPTPPTAIGWEPFLGEGPPLAHWLSRNAYRYTHLSPPWLRLVARGPFEQVGWDARLTRAFAAVYRMQFVPEIRVEEAAALDFVPAETLAARAAAFSPDGVFVNFAHTEGALALPRLTAWLQGLSQALEAAGIRMLVRFPAYFEQAVSLPAIAGVLPNLQIAAAADSPVATPGDAVVRAETARLPIEDLDLTLYYELADLSVTGEVWSAEMRSELLRQEGHAAFAAGDFARAIETWSQWSEFEPHNEEPVSLIGDVHLRMGDLDRATEAYVRSLEMNPGQVGLALRLARLQDSAGQPDRARDTLNLYARIFPNHPDIALAQAEWLVRRDRRAEAGDLIRRVLGEYPEDLRALTLLHPLLPTAADRIRNLRALLELGSRPGMEVHFAAAIRDQGLIALPESWLLMDFLERMAREAPPGQRAAFEQLLPLEETVTEDFRTGRLSDRWIASADHEPDVAGSLLVGAQPSQTEAFLRLARSDAMVNGFVEVTIEEARGYFWLYARRGESSMIRFGFDQTGNLFLQAWRDGHLLANETRFWARPPGPVTLRLEVRADGAMGYIGGRPVFPAPVTIPRDLGLGWWGLAPWAPQFGLAQVAVRRVGGGPLPVRLALLRADDERRPDADVLRILKPHARDLSAVAPRWFAQEMDGALRKEARGDHADLRIFCRYYRIRLLPVVRSAAPLALRVDELVRTAREENVDGFTLQVARMPPEEWFRQMEEALVDSGILLVVAAFDEEGGRAVLREASPGLGLFAGRRIERTIPLRAETGTAEPEEDAPLRPMDETGAHAVLML